MKIVSICRPSPGTDDYPLFLRFLDYDKTTFNFDDRNYGYNLGGDANLFFRIYFRLIRFYLKNKFNKEIENYIKSDSPDLLFIFNGSYIREETIDLAIKNKIFVVFYYPDLDPKIHGQKYLNSLSKANLLFYTKPNLISYFEKINPSSQLIKPLISKNFIGEIEHSDSEIGVLLVAHYSKGKSQLLNLFCKYYKKRITLVGSNWNKCKYLDKNQMINYIGPLFGYRVFSLYKKAVCCLGFLMEAINNSETGDLITARSFNIPAYGGLLLHPRNKESEKLYGSDAKYLFSNIKQLSELAFQISNNELFRKKLFAHQHRAILNNCDYAEDLVDGIIERLK